MTAPIQITARELIATYDALLIDAYGVLVDARSALPGAAELIAAAAEANRRVVVVTNDASRLPATVAARFARFGLAIDADQIVTSGSLIAAAFAARGLAGARTAVLGPADSIAYGEQAGGVVVPTSATADYDAIVVCDEAGYPFLEAVDAVLSALFRLIDRGRCPALLLPNPDLIYPDGRGGYGVTAGGAALLLEHALARRYPDAPPRFDRLGKPHRPIFDEALRRAGVAAERAIMIGDQLETDIAGARAAGIDAALVDSGISRWQPGHAAPALAPTHLLRGWHDLLH